MRLIDAEPLEKILRSRCAQCSNDYGSIAGAISGFLKLVQIQPVISPPPNDPLTLEELWEMDGEPVFVQWNSTNGFYALIYRIIDGGLYYLTAEGRSEYAPFPLYGDDWLAYRRKPEEACTAVQLPVPAWAEHFKASFERMEGKT